MKRVVSILSPNSEEVNVAGNYSPYNTVMSSVSHTRSSDALNSD